MTVYFCCDERRRIAVRDHAALDGIDYLEVVDQGVPPAERQRTLRVHFLKSPPVLVNALTAENVRIEGGARVRNVQAIDAEWDDGVFEVEVNQPGDYSVYTLRLTDPDGQRLEELDPLLSAVEFSFKVDCPTDFDCLTERACPAEPLDEPEIDYLARDYASFRRLMLDRMSVIMPGWQERNPADLGVALVELLAYTADRMSYQQDVIATEYSLNTARRRASIRRHARLVDYPVHDGTNARVWVHVEVIAATLQLPGGTPLITQVPGVAPRIAPHTPDYNKAVAARPLYFETMYDATLHASNNLLHFYTWGERECCLPRGATRAVLRGRQENLHENDVIIFTERVGPRTGETEDADPKHRQAVLLTDVAYTEDPLFLEADGVTPLQLTEITWGQDDALAFPLCISAITDDEHGRQYIDDVSVALGNIVLADHGRTVTGEPAEEGDPPGEPLGQVPEPDRRLALAAAGGSFCGPVDPVFVPPRFNPVLSEGPLTMASSTPVLEWSTGSASAVFNWDVQRVLPAITLHDSAGRPWSPQRDLLASSPFALEFVAEVDEAGRASIRFGDDEYGLRPAPSVRFGAIYRVGNGTSGNIGAESLAHIIRADSGVASVTNPMPARGGTDPESLQHVRLSAPSAFRVPQRAVTAEDYAEVAARDPQVQRAVATERWTGSWYTIFLTVDRVAGLPVDSLFEQRIRDHLERFRMAGYDIEIDGPRFVPLEIEIHVCVLPDYYRSDVAAALLEVFADQVNPDGRKGFFHPDNFTFGQPVYLSRIYAAAQDVPGVRFVEVRTFQRLGQESRAALDSGVLETGRLEIPRLDNDPSFPEHGVLRLSMEGGQ